VGHVDRRHFDPIAAYPSVAEHAGYEAKLLRMEARYVRDDGTIDVEASNINVHQAVVQYDFVRPIIPPNPRAHFTGITESLLPPSIEWLRDWDGLAVRPVKVGGLYLTATAAGDDAPSHAIPFPVCSFALLWSRAKERGAPPSTTATITYDAAGYDVRIDGTQLRLVFDQQCREVATTS
jgi:hypothetical protein